VAPLPEQQIKQISNVNCAGQLKSNGHLDQLVSLLTDSVRNRR
jgi:hypothetical protein